MASQIELVYFGGPGRAELSRLTLHAGGIAFTDTRIQFPDWPAIKGDPNSLPGSLLGSMPCLKDGDFKLCQSQATAQYAGDLSFPNRTAKERAIDGMYVGIHADLQTEMYKCLFGTDESKAAAAKEISEKVTPLLERVEKLLPAESFINGKDHPTVADLALFDVVTSPFPGLRALSVDLSSFPKLNALVEKTKGAL